MELFELSAKLALDTTSFMDGVQQGIKESVSLKSALLQIGSAAIKGVQNLTASGDKIAKSSEKLGISVETYQKLGYAIEMSGGSVDSLYTGTQNLYKFLEGSAGKKASEAFEKLGFSKESLEQMGSADEQIQAIIDAIANLDDKAEQAAIGEAIFGKNASGTLATFFSEGEEGIKRLKAQAEELGLVRSQEEIDAAVKANDTMADLQKTIDNLATTALTPLLEPLNNIVQALTPAVVALTPLIEKASQALVDIINFALRLFGIGGEEETANKNAEYKAQSGEDLYSELKGVYEAGGDVGAYMREKFGEAAEKYIDNVLNAFSVEMTGKTQSGKTVANPEGMATAAKASLSNLISDYEKASVDITAQAGNVTDAFANVDSAARNAASAMNSIPSYSPDGSHASGLDYVPYDDYRAKLHRGEMVLTSSQARQYRDGGSMDYSGLLSGIVNAVRQGMEGAVVKSYLSGREITDEVTRNMGNAMKARRYAT